MTEQLVPIVGIELTTYRFLGDVRIGGFNGEHGVELVRRLTPELYRLRCSTNASTG
ncbi:hypothetical protein [Ramlibacter sp. Leaf400]|uniref:hypothetical protein n=1 Tax=Ramlibacter sp. Leaf400 TaxID=1736365 RepID=UPI0012E3BE0F|nr:hypothetical protein [Ramlibacter sp. Leaf400]